MNDQSNKEELIAAYEQYSKLCNEYGDALREYTGRIGHSKAGKGSTKLFKILRGSRKLLI